MTTYDVRSDDGSSLLLDRLSKPSVNTPCRLALLLASPDNAQCNTRDDVEEKNGNFVKQNSGKVDRVKLFGRQMKPYAHKFMHPIVSNHKVQEPPQN